MPPASLHEIPEKGTLLAKQRIVYCRFSGYFATGSWKRANFKAKQV